MRRFIAVSLALLLLPSFGVAQSGGYGLLDTLGLAQFVKARELAAHERLLARIAASDGRPDIFHTDGCSGGLSASWQQLAALWPTFAQRHQGRPPFESCCETHDRAYHDIRGARTALQSYEARLRADRQLQRCVLKTGLSEQQDLEKFYGFSAEEVTRIYDHLGKLMFHAVRFGGGPCTGQPWRWGYGYPGC